MSIVAEPRYPVNDSEHFPHTEGSLALALPTLEASKSARRAYPTASDLGLGLDGHRERFFNRLPAWVTVSPRHAFDMQRTVPREQAVLWDEIAPDPKDWITSLRVDVDRDGWDAYLHTLCLPEPTYIVKDPATGRGHAIWSLGVWIRKTDVRAMRYFQRLRQVYVAAIGGDRSYSGKFHHNPLSARYRTTVGAKADWTLNELALYVADVLFDAKPSQHTWATSKIRKDVAALGRNCKTFETVRIAAYAAVERFRANDTAEGFTNYVQSLVEAENATCAVPMPSCDIRSLVKSIATWTWHVYRQGKAAAAARRKRYETTRAAYLARGQERREEARRLRAGGMTRSAIANALGISLSTVANYLRGGELATIETVQSPPPIRTYAQGAEGGAAASPDKKNDPKDVEIQNLPVSASNVIPFRSRSIAAPAESADPSPSPLTNGPQNVQPNIFTGPHGVSHPRTDRDEYGPTKRSAEYVEIFARFFKFVFQILLMVFSRGRGG